MISSSKICRIIQNDQGGDQKDAFWRKQAERMRSFDKSKILSCATRALRAGWIVVRVGIIIHTKRSWLRFLSQHAGAPFFALASQKNYARKVKLRKSYCEANSRKRGYQGCVRAMKGLPDSRSLGGWYISQIPDLQYHRRRIAWRRNGKGHYVFPVSDTVFCPWKDCFRYVPIIPWSNPGNLKLPQMRD